MNTLMTNTVVLKYLKYPILSFVFIVFNTRTRNEARVNALRASSYPGSEAWVEISAFCFFFSCSVTNRRLVSKAHASPVHTLSTWNMPFAGSGHMVRNKLHWDATVRTKELVPVQPDFPL